MTAALLERDESETRDAIRRTAEFEADLNEHSPIVRGGQRVYHYWRTVLPKSWTDQDVRVYSETKSWCGGFALFCWRESGIAADLYWRDGIGFALWSVTSKWIVSSPEIGDVIHFPHSKQHYGIVVGVERKADGSIGYVDTVEGNTPQVSRRRHSWPVRGAVYFSAQKQIDKWRGGE